MPKVFKITILKNLCNISRGEVMLKVLKIISLQNPCNRYLKEEVRNEVDFWCRSTSKFSAGLARQV